MGVRGHSNCTSIVSCIVKTRQQQQQPVPPLAIPPAKMPHLHLTQVESQTMANAMIRPTTSLVTAMARLRAPWLFSPVDPTTFAATTRKLQCGVGHPPLANASSSESDSDEFQWTFRVQTWRSEEDWHHQLQVRACDNWWESATTGYDATRARGLLLDPSPPPPRAFLAWVQLRKSAAPPVTALAATKALPSPVATLAVPAATKTLPSPTAAELVPTSPSASLPTVPVTQPTTASIATVPAATQSAPARAVSAARARTQGARWLHVA